MSRSILITAFALALTASVGHAEQTLTGQAAEDLYNQLSGPVHGPYCTGACFPNRPCDPTCFSSKEGEGYRCSDTRHTRTGLEEYQCVPQNADEASAQ
jgi:hypothetical protein